MIIFFKAVHRLDQDTSGILVIAKSADVHRNLSSQFASRQVNKIYEAVLAGVIAENEGKIDLPLWANPDNRPLQEVNYGFGKDAVTGFRVMACDGITTRVEFFSCDGAHSSVTGTFFDGFGFSY